ncbi:ricin-type beta-trefoil lectin domain protein [Rhizoctonia solani]|uniref:Ricin-type beta-trefoil lectin domain protein n=1 Tax=Rhizoctonia solani TaxID=456999 RepID=A0A8H8SW86_9AGAM|nr:ricin-type beta-trefoil lectin domain protein [Rhizoctonia solani]QRW20289.1 ricin-type beta-trefoil lectin domain protein [Rhizoctonia solani]
MPAAAVVLALAGLAAAQYPAYTGQLLVSPGSNAGKCLDAENRDGAPVKIADCNGSANQKWSFGSKSHVVKIHGNKCLDVKDGVNADGTKLQIWTCNESSQNQKFWYSFWDYTLSWEGKGTGDFTKIGIIPVMVESLIPTVPMAMATLMSATEFASAHAPALTQLRIASTSMMSWAAAGTCLPTMMPEPSNLAMPTTLSLWVFMELLLGTRASNPPCCPPYPQLLQLPYPSYSRSGPVKRSHKRRAFSHDN